MAPFSLLVGKKKERVKNMAKIRQNNASTLFRVIVLPATVLCAVFRKPAFQWLTVAALALWLLILLIGHIKGKTGKRVSPRRRDRKTKSEDQVVAAQTEDARRAESESEQQERLTDQELCLVRQINSRVTEQLKDTYPAVSWLWVKRPTADEFSQGGAWRIKLANTEPFNFAEVSLHKDGRLVITMIQAVFLKDAKSAEEEQDDLKQSEILERVDVKSWYSSAGERILSDIVDDLNSQGHKRAVVKEDGSVVITQSGKEEAVDMIPNFPPRAVWDEFCQLLREDDYEASIQPNGLALAW